MIRKAAPYAVFILLSSLAALIMMASLRNDAREAEELKAAIGNTQIWYYDELDYALEKYAGEMSSDLGKSDFRPYVKMTRDEMDRMIGMIDGSDDTDMAQGKSIGHDGVTRLQASRAIYSLISSEASDEGNGSAWNDGSYSDTDAIEPNELLRLGIMSTPMSGGQRRFHPGMEMTRIEGVMLLNRTYAFLHEPEALKAINRTYEGFAGEVPVLMYHSVDDRAGSWSYTTVPTLKLENDVRHLIASGYRGASFSQAIAHMDGFKPMDFKPFLVTFDDGYMDNYVNGFKVLSKYRVPFLISVYRLDDGHLSAKERAGAKRKLTPEAIREMDRSNLVEFGNHAYSFHKIDRETGRKLLDFKDGETVKDYRKRVMGDLSLQNDAIREMVGYTPAVFTYPFGYYNDELAACVEDMGFRASLSTRSGIWSIEDDGPFAVKRMNMPFNMSSTNMVKAIGMR